MSYSRIFPGWNEQIGQARRWVDNVLAAHAAFRIPDDTVAATVLLVSEAATNAVSHTASGRGGVFTLRLEIAPGRIAVDVDDEGKAEAVPFLRPNTFMSERGRGIALIDHFAHAWRPLPAPRSGVTFTLLYPAVDPARRGDLPSG
ncbi:ATP-binding protein [Nocardiopsis mangrovi]|uniref:ATP-binding protein n=1 Tax=Nocardiopsis mangrovi TaxID=1179818 RepID=A0ABV9DVQ4_9ACTN